MEYSPLQEQKVELAESHRPKILRMATKGRTELSPKAQAALRRVLLELRADHRTQKEIARAARVDQGQVSKALTWLDSDGEGGVLPGAETGQKFAAARGYDRDEFLRGRLVRTQTRAPAALPPAPLSVPAERNRAIDPRLDLIGGVHDPHLVEALQRCAPRWLTATCERLRHISRFWPVDRPTELWILDGDTIDRALRGSGWADIADQSAQSIEDAESRDTTIPPEMRRAGK